MFNMKGTGKEGDLSIFAEIELVNRYQLIYVGSERSTPFSNTKHPLFSIQP